MKLQATAAPRAAFPLNWPAGRARTAVDKVREARFTAPFARAYDNLLDELERLGATDIIVSSNVPLRPDGMPQPESRRRADAAVAVHFNLNGEGYCIACDGYRRVAWNLRAIAVTVAAHRTIARHGSVELQQQALDGFRQLPAATPQSCWDVLGVPSTATMAEIAAAAQSAVVRCTDDLTAATIFRAAVEARSHVARRDGAIACVG